MAENKKQVSRRTRTTTAKTFDIAPAEKKRPSSNQFPAVGMTLSSYTGTTASKPSRSSSTFSEARPRSKRITRKRVLSAIVIIIFIIGGWLGFKLVYNAQRLFGGNVFSVLKSEKLKGEGQGRVNILLAGNSADDVGHQGGTLTDSIMIMSIDTKNKTGFMLSVPRDLYVQVNGKNHAKINTAYPTGESQNFNETGFTEGGMGLLEQIVQENLGITCQYYALVNYNALRDAVNSVGGVDFKVVSDDKRGLYDPSKDYTTGGVLVKLSNGIHHLNGQQALDLARARGDARGSYGFANSDFDRTENQRKLILALRSKATSGGVLANPVKLGKLFDAIGGNVKTDLKLGNVRRLYDVTKGIGGTSLQSVGLNDADGQNLLKNYRSPRGESALIPAAGLDDFSDIQRYLQRLTSSNLIIRENADVVILNGTTMSGLAARESETLDSKNIRISTVGDAGSGSYLVTQIIDLSTAKKPATLIALQKYYPGATVSTTNPFGTKYKDANFIIILGDDRKKVDTTN